MKLLEVKTSAKKIKYKGSFSVAGVKIEKRDAYNISVKTDLGTATSELSLLENFHSVSYSECLAAYSGNLKNYKEWHPQIKYPIEAALFTLANNTDSCDGVALNGYYDPSADTKVPDLDCLKLKIARTALEDEIKLLKSLKDKFLRLDANQKLDSEKFQSYLNILENYDYFEEPFSDVKQILNFPNERFALDENVENEELQVLPQVVTFVIKPSLLGLEKTILLISRAKSLGKRIVISSTFEGEEGLISLIKIAQYVDNQLGNREFHGLGTIRFLEPPLKSIIISVVNNTAILKI